MTKWILAIAAMFWFSDYTLPMMNNPELLHDSAMALVVALIMQPWVVSQLDG